MKLAAPVKPVAGVNVKPPLELSATVPWLAGGGVRGGLVHGATDAVGYQAVEHRHYYSDLHATILQQLGLDYKRMEIRVIGRTMKLVEEGDGPIKEILN